MMKIEKILTISAEEYCKMYGKDLASYIPIGIHFEDYIDSGETKNFIKEFAKKVPDTAEVVVSFQQPYGGTYPRWSRYYASGTALVPKNNQLGGG